jgi:hypothetical protein
LQANDALAAHDPSYRRDAGPLHTDLTADELRALLPLDTVLLRIDWHDADRLSVIAVSVRDHVLTARHALVSIPRQPFQDVADFARNHRAAQVGPLDEALARIDLLGALGGQAFAHAIVLPDPATSRLPLAALGPVGNRLLDRCEDITWLPNLLPLRTRQAPHGPRSGSLMFAPRAFGDTRWHDLALQHPLEDEQQYLDRAASVENVRRLAPRADVVAFYAHGKHIDGQAAMQRHDDLTGPSLLLAGGDRLSLTALITEWAGAERIELWGCESGVSLSADPFPVIVDEAFGFDYEFLKVGARSAIGSLYPVAEVPTAVMLAHYRRRLSEGALAPRALADAQRYWVTTAMPEILALVTSDPTDGLARYARARGVSPPSTPPGNVARPPDPATYARMFGSPLVWAAFRFVGVCERRPAARR